LKRLEISLLDVRLPPGPLASKYFLFLFLVLFVYLMLFSKDFLLLAQVLLNELDKSLPDLRGGALDLLKEIERMDHEDLG